MSFNTKLFFYIDGIVRVECFNHVRHYIHIFLDFYLFNDNIDICSLAMHTNRQPPNLYD